jgi:creatine kinase
MNKHRILKSKVGGISLGDPKDTDDFKYFTYPEFPKFTSDHSSLMATLLTKEIFDKLIHKKTSKNYTFSNAIQAGSEYPFLQTGITTADQESYIIFKEIINPVIKARHKFDPDVTNQKNEINPSKLNLSSLKKFNLDKYIVSSRIRSARNIADFALPPGILKEERVDLESYLRSIFDKLSQKWGGQYHSLAKMPEDQKKSFRSKGFLFQDPEPTTVLLNCGSARNWPNERGIFISDNQQIMCWCNEEDHCRIISLQEGSDIIAVFENFAKLSDTFIDKVESSGKKIMYSSNLGFISTCPSNLGTGLRASVKIKLNKLIENKEMLHKISKENNLDIRGAGGDGSLTTGYIFDISNKQRLGFTETELVQKMIDGIVQLMSFEEQN